MLGMNQLRLGDGPRALPLLEHVLRQRLSESSVPNIETADLMTRLAGLNFRLGNKWIASSYLAELAGFAMELKGPSSLIPETCHALRCSIALTQGDICQAKRLALRSSTWDQLDSNGELVPRPVRLPDGAGMSVLAKHWLEDSVVKLIDKGPDSFKLEVSRIYLWNGIPSTYSELEQPTLGVGRPLHPIVLWFRGVKRSSYYPIEISPTTGARLTPSADAKSCELGPFTGPDQDVPSVTMICRIDPWSTTFFDWKVEAREVHFCIQATDASGIIPAADSSIYDG